MRATKVFIPLEPDLGMEAEVDWGGCHAILGGEYVKLKMFCMRSKGSGKPFVRCVFPASGSRRCLRGTWRPLLSTAEYSAA